MLTGFVNVIVVIVYVSHLLHYGLKPSDLVGVGVDLYLHKQLKTPILLVIIYILFDVVITLRLEELQMCIKDLDSSKL